MEITGRQAIHEVIISFQYEAPPVVPNRLSDGVSTAHVVSKKN
jgi:hypothetical protein